MAISVDREYILSRLWRDETDDPKTQEWREDLTEEEELLVENWERQVRNIELLEPKEV